MARGLASRAPEVRGCSFSGRCGPVQAARAACSATATATAAPNCRCAAPGDGPLVLRLQGVVGEDPQTGVQRPACGFVARQMQAACGHLAGPEMGSATGPAQPVRQGLGGCQAEQGHGVQAGAAAVRAHGAWLHGVHHPLGCGVLAGKHGVAIPCRVARQGALRQAGLASNGSQCVAGAASRSAVSSARRSSSRCARRCTCWMDSRWA